MTRTMLLAWGKRRGSADLPKPMLLAVTTASIIGVCIYAVVADANPFGFVAGILGALLASLGVTDFLATRSRIQSQELEQRASQLEAVLKDKEVFLAGVSHEVRSPLTAMMGFIELVNESGEALPAEERAEMLQTVSRQATDVLSLVEDLLTSARVEAGSLSVRSVRTNLGAQARQVIEGIGETPRKTIEYRGEDAVALADPARVRQVVRNLLTNAIRYGGDDVVVVTSTREGVAVLEVLDNGHGIPANDREAVFEPFSRSDGVARVEESVGLGLHVSRDLARLMGGDLTYSYEEGWSRFQVAVPLFIDRGQTSGRHQPELIA